MPYPRKQPAQHSTMQLSPLLEGVDEVCQLVPWLRKVWTLRAGSQQESRRGAVLAQEA